MEFGLDAMVVNGHVHKDIFHSLRHNKNGENAANRVVTVYNQ